MSITITVSDKDQCTVSPVEATSLDEGALFRDGEGDLFVRVSGGCFFLGSTEPCVYSSEEMQDFENNDFFQECIPVKGTVVVSVELQE